MNDQNGYYEPPRHIEAARVYTAGQRWLLLFTVAMGAVFAFVFLGKQALSSDRLSGLMLPYGIFWAVYAAGFYFAAWPKAKGKRTGWALLLVALWLSARSAVYRETSLTLLNFLVLPLVMMLHAVECAFEAPATRQGAYLAMDFKGWFVAPGARIGRFFGAAGSVFSKKEGNPRARAVRLGLLCGLPVLIVVFSLLLSADAAMEYYFTSLFRADNAGPTALRLLCALTVAALFYSFLTYMVYEEKNVPQEPYRQSFQPVAVNTVAVMLLCAYALFAAFQFAYLTGLAGLPAELSYSQYAVRGFGELCAVAGINLTVFALCLTFTPDNRTTRGLLLALLIATALLLTSALYRLCLYIDAYGLTVNRILPLWFMLYLLAAIALCAARLFRPIRLLRLCAGALVLFYLALSVVNLDAVIAKSVLKKADERGALSQTDADYLRYTLSSDARGVLERSAWRQQIYYDVSAGDVPGGAVSQTQESAPAAEVSENKAETALLTISNDSEVRVYSVLVSRKHSSGGGQNADGSPLAAGDSLTFEMPAMSGVPFTVSVYGAEEEMLWMGKIERDFSNGDVKLSITGDAQGLRVE